MASLIAVVFLEFYVDVVCNVMTMKEHLHDAPGLINFLCDYCVLSIHSNHTFFVVSFDKHEWLLL